MPQDRETIEPFQSEGPKDTAAYRNAPPLELHPVNQHYREPFRATAERRDSETAAGLDRHRFNDAQGECCGHDLR